MKQKISKRGFNSERTKFFEASLSDTLSRSNQLQSTRRGNENSMQSIGVVSQQRLSDPQTLPKRNAWPILTQNSFEQLFPNPWGCNRHMKGSVFCKYLPGGD